MKAKSSFSGIVVDTTAKGAIGLATAIAVFIACFVVWSVAGVGTAIAQLIGGM